MSQVVWKLCRSGPNVAADPLVCMSLPPSKHRWVTSALLLRLPTTSLDSVSSTDALTTTDSAAVIPVEDSSLSPYWLVCGDRKGSLHVYQTNLSTKENEVTIRSDDGLILFVSFPPVYTAYAVTAWCPWFQWSNPHHSERGTSRHLW